MEHSIFKKSSWVIILLLIVISCKVKSKTGKVSNTGIENISNSYIKEELNTEGLQEFLDRKIDSLEIPGISLAIIKNGEIFLHQEAGYSDIEKQTPVNKNTIFEACSMSKPAFAYFVLKMRDKGLIDLDRPLYEYFVYDDIAYDERHKLITARMILAHRSGLPNWHEYEPADPSLNVPEGAQYLKFDPGTSFYYSGEGYQYLVDVVCHILETDVYHLSEIVEKEIFRPMGIRRAKFGWDNFIESHKAKGYRFKEGINEPGTLKKFEEFSAAGGLHTSAIDYARFMIGMMDCEELSSKSCKEMFSEVSDLPEEWDADFWGLGIEITETKYGRMFSHSGDNGDFTCYSLFFEDTKDGYVYLTNSNLAWDIYEDLYRYILKQ